MVQGSLVEPSTKPAVSSGRREPRRDMRGSTKYNADFKWKHEKSVVGALEVETNPELDLRAEMIRHCVPGYGPQFNAYYEVFKELKLRDEFIKAFESIPPVTTCCGKVTCQDETIKNNAKLLNKGWVKATNKKVFKHGFRLSIFVWRWSNVAGKAETVIPMIRFHTLSEQSDSKRRRSPTNADC